MSRRPLIFLLCLIVLPAAAAPEGPSPYAVAPSTAPAAFPLPERGVPVPREGESALPPASAPVPASVPSPAQAAPAQDAAARPARKTVSLDLREMEVVEVLKLLSRQSGLNIVVGKNVSGRVTVFLNNVDFWEALRTILETRDLAFVKEGDLVRVVTAQDYERTYGVAFGDKTEMKTFVFRHIKAKSAKDVMDPLKSKVGNLVLNEMNNTLVAEETPDQLARMEEMARAMDVPTETRVFVLNHAAVDELLPKIQPLVSKEYGMLQVDKRTNTLVVTDNPARVAEMAAFIGAFDARSRTVLIEAKMVQVSLKDEFQWGVNWERAFRAVDVYPGGRTFSGVAVGNTQVVPLAEITGLSGASAPLGVTAKVMSVSGLQFSGAVNFLERFGKTRILSSPRITALNNQEAKISVGTEEAYITRTVINPGSTTQTPTVTETVNFKPVGVELSVTPVIGADGFMTLKLKPTVSSVEDTVTTKEGSTIPIIRKSAAETSLVVKDGVTVVIGGLIEDRKSDDNAGVPGLSRLPLVGLLFKSKVKSLQKTELVIFLTPRIVEGEASSPEAQMYLPEAEWPEDLPKKKRGFFRRLFGGGGKDAAG